MTVHCPLFVPGDRIVATLNGDEYPGTYLHRLGMDDKDANGTREPEYSVVKLDIDPPILQVQRNFHNASIRPLDTTNHPAWKEMMAISKLLEIPTSYRDDLYIHDREWLTIYPDTQFVWVLRPLGTNCVGRFNNQNNMQLRYVTNTFSNDGMRLFMWNGHKLTECNIDEAHMFLGSLKPLD